jgi:tetratricopeptide (TPR) repeat protein
MSTLARSVAVLLLLLAPAVSSHADDSLSYSTQATELMGRGEYEKALDSLRRGHSLYPYDETLKRTLSATYAQIAQRDLKEGRYREAAENFGQARELSPTSADLGLMRGVALYLSKNYDSAKAELTQLPPSVNSLFFLGKVSYDTGDLHGALALWRRGLEIDAKDKETLAMIEKVERELPVEEKMEKGYSSMFDLSFDAELPQGLSAEVLDALEDAYNSVGTDLGRFPTARIPVLLYTKKDYSSVTTSPDWSAGLYDGKIRLPVGGVTSITPHMRAILFHEFTHVLVAEIARNNVPTWLNEGLAEIQGRKQFPPQTPDLAAAARDGRLIPMKTLAGSFTGLNGAEAGIAYQQSYSLVSFMVSRYGWYAVQQMLKYLGERASMEVAVAKALADWSLDLSGVVSEWRETLPAAVEAQAEPI